MYSRWKKPKFDLRDYYTLLLELGMIVVLVTFLVAMKVRIIASEEPVEFTQEQSVVQMEEIIRTKQLMKPPPPPPPPVPVAVPNDEVVMEQFLDIDAELNIGESLQLPPPPKKEVEEREEEDFFIVVEQMPELKGGMTKLQRCVQYPEMARRAGIEGRVIVRFVVNEQGRVEDPEVIRGIGGGADEEALRCVKASLFEPGRQRGTPVKVQYTLPVIFRLQN